MGRREDSEYAVEGGARGSLAPQEAVSDLPVTALLFSDQRNNTAQHNNNLIAQKVSPHIDTRASNNPLTDTIIVRRLSFQREDGGPKQD